MKNKTAAAASRGKEDEEIEMTLSALLAIIALIAAAVAWLFTGQNMNRAKSALMGLPMNAAIACNIAEGTHSDTEGGITRTADAAHTETHSLVKVGTDEDHIAICGANDVPVGVCDDLPAAGDEVNVLTLGGASRTRMGRAAEAIAAGVPIYTAASGRLQDLPGTSGTYYMVGTSLKAAAAAGDLFEFAPCAAVKVTV